MFALKQQHDAPQQHRSSSSASIIEQLIGQLGVAGVGANSDRSASRFERKPSASRRAAQPTTINVRLSKQSQHLRSKLDKFQFGIRSDLRRSFGRFVEAATRRGHALGIPSDSRSAAAAHSKPKPARVLVRTRSTNLSERRRLAGTKSSLFSSLRRSHSLSSRQPKPTTLHRARTLNQKKQQPAPQNPRHLGARAATAAALASKLRALNGFFATSEPRLRQSSVSVAPNERASTASSCSGLLASATQAKQQTNTNPRLVSEMRPDQSRPAIKSGGQVGVGEQGNTMASLLAGAARRQRRRSVVGQRLLPLPAGVRLLCLSALKVLLLVMLSLALEPATAAPILVESPTVIEALLSNNIASASGDDLLKVGRAQLSPDAQPDDEPDLDGLIERIQLLEQEKMTPQARQQPQSDMGELLWIERRRLDRNRALEPPAWLRTRPIRRDRQTETSSTQEANEWIEAEDETGQQLGQLDGVKLGLAEAQQPSAQDNASKQRASLFSERPKRRLRLGHIRQLRDSTSDAIYDEILRQLVEEALSSRSYLDKVFDELDARNEQQQLAHNKAGPPLASSTLVDQAGLNRGASNARLQQDDTLPKTKQQLTGAEETLVIAGDEVSDTDDVTLIEPTLIEHKVSQPIATDAKQVVLAVGSGLARQAHVSADGKTTASMDGQNTMPQRFLGMNSGVSPVSILAQAPAQAPLQAPLARPSSETEQAAEEGLLQAGPLAAQQRVNLLDALQHSTSALSGSMEFARPAPEETFHVVEDIDMVDNNEELPSRAPSGETGAPQEGQQQQLVGSNADDQMPTAELSKLRKRTFELEASGGGDTELPVAARPAGFESAERHSQPSYGRTEQATTPAWTTDGASKQDLRASQQARLLGAALKLIKSGLYSREQLLDKATQLRAHIEQALGLSPGAIGGLFPVNSQQLLVQLDESKLSPRDRHHLNESFNSSDAMSAFVLDWSAGGADVARAAAGASGRRPFLQRLPTNPAPLLAAILEAIGEDASTAISKGAQLGDNSLLAAYGGQINELGDQPLADGLVSTANAFGGRAQRASSIYADLLADRNERGATSETAGDKQRDAAADSGPVEADEEEEEEEGEEDGGVDENDAEAASRRLFGSKPRPRRPASRAQAGVQRPYLKLADSNIKQLGRSQNLNPLLGNIRPPQRDTRRQEALWSPSPFRLGNVVAGDGVDARLGQNQVVLLAPKPRELAQSFDWPLSSEQYQFAASRLEGAPQSPEPGVQFEYYNSQPVMPPPQTLALSPQQQQRPQDNSFATYLATLYSLGLLQRPQQHSLPALSQAQLDGLSILNRKLALATGQSLPPGENERSLPNGTSALGALGGGKFGSLFDALSMRNEEHVYASIWFQLSAILIAILGALFIGKLCLKKMLNKFSAARTTVLRCEPSCRRFSNLTACSSSTSSSKARLWVPSFFRRSSQAMHKQNESGSDSGSLSDGCEGKKACDHHLDDKRGHQTIKGETSAGASKQHDLGHAPSTASFLHKRGLSADSGLDTIDGGHDGGGSLAASSAERMRKSLDLLSQKLARLLSSKGCDDRAAAEVDVERAVAAVAAAADSRAEKDSHSQLGDGAPQTVEPQQSRSSTSYIRSLIDALTKAASAQISGSGGLSERRLESGETSDNDEDFGDRVSRARSSPSGVRLSPPSGANESVNTQHHRHLFVDDLDEVLVSQMDISAAHLILDYMEKHLVDKKRLRCEWLELNATAPSSKNGAKATQLLLRKLAKAALSEENFDKNRNPNVVPYDRNRVRLGQIRSERPLSGGTIDCAQQAGPTSSAGVRVDHHKGAHAASKQRAHFGVNKLASQAPPSDYINASFIHDHDPRWPTYIIAQGPTEQTCGQFWQMVWEQEILIIVMLTRLNENDAQMCHCYWPTNVVSAPASIVAVEQQLKTSNNRSIPAAEISLCSSSRSASNSSSSVRRGSVTSVFSGAAQPLASSLANGQLGFCSPIVADGDLNDSVLYFDVPTALAMDPFRTKHFSSGPIGETEEIDELHEVETSITPTTSAGLTAPCSTKKKGQVCPDSGNVKFEVHLISEHVSATDYLVRNMLLINRTTGETRTISQFHYLAWSDGRTPEDVRSFLKFRRKVNKSYRNSGSPILVHCSDGGGRSGTYTLIDMILERIRDGVKEIDLRATLEHLRDQRVGLCETQSQFEFALVALAEEIQIILNALPG